MSNKNTGAPAALARLEKEELQCYEKKEEIAALLNALEEPPLNASEEQRELWATQKTRLESDLLFAFKRWDVARKALMEYDKSVAVEKREGEKIPIAEAKEIFAQLMLSINLALEQCAISSAQSAALCDSPEKFYKEHAENWRAAKDGAIASALGDGVIPKWLVEK